ncbi:MAG: DUF2635 domain-containing protein [Desulfovibrionaceae bacterium]|nr:DUF2635 domain-containing protein [Desulfovibrionaceae bacterium]
MSHPAAFFVKPAPGLRIPDPASGDCLPEQGRLVPRSGYWLRRLKAGDVVLAEAPSVPAAPKKAAPKPGEKKE